MTILYLISTFLIFKSFKKVTFLFAVCFILIGLVGAIFFSMNFIHFLICIEFIYYSIILIFISSLTLNNMNEGFVIYPLIILSLAAAEAAVGLSLLLLTSKIHKSVSLSKFNKFKG